MSPPVIHKSFVIERTYPAPASRVFRGFSDATKKRRWFAEGEGFVVDAYSLDFRVGGKESCRFRPVGGPPMTFEGVYLDILENERIVLAYAMTLNGAPMSSSLSTVELLLAKEGSLLRYTEHTAFTDGVDGSEGRRQGSVELHEALARELEKYG